MSTPATVRRVRRSHGERSGATRRQLVQATIDVVRERSYHGASVFEVAKAAGVTPGALQHHFGSKAALMLHVLETILGAEGPDALTWPAPSLSLATRAQRFVQVLWTHLYEPPRFLVAWDVYFGSCHDPAMREAIARQRAPLADTLHARFLAVFPEAAGDAGIGAFIDLVLSALRGLGVLRLFGPQPESCRAQLDELARLVVMRLAAPPARRRPVSPRRTP